MKSKLDSCGGGASPTPRPTPPTPRPPPPTPRPTPTPLRQPVRNAGRDCWGSCGHKGGYCPSFCGVGNACCRRGWSRDPQECRGINTFRTGHHECVAPAGGSRPSPRPTPTPSPRPTPPSGGGSMVARPNFMIRQSNSNYLASCPSQHGFRKQPTSIGPVCLKQHGSDIRNSAKSICESLSDCKAITVGMCRG